jgi:hypothetical protein
MEIKLAMPLASLFIGLIKILNAGIVEIFKLVKNITITFNYIKT